MICQIKLRVIDEAENDVSRIIGRVIVDNDDLPGKFGVAFKSDETLKGFSQTICAIIGANYDRDIHCALPSVPHPVPYTKDCHTATLSDRVEIQ